MGIGVSFTGLDGSTRTVQAESPAEVRSALELAMGQSSQAMGMLTRRQAKRQQHIENITNIINNFTKGRKGKGAGGAGDEDGEGKVKIDADDTPGYLQDKVHKEGSFICDAFSRNLQLHGDTKPGSKPKVVYGDDANGKRGFHTLDEIDPTEEGKGFVIGDPAATSNDKEIKDMRLSSSSSPFTITYLSRIALVEDENLEGFIHVYVFVRDLSFTGYGRAHKVSRETRIPLGMFDILGGGGNGMGLFAYDSEKKKIEGGAVCFARRYYEVQEASVSSSGKYRIKVSMRDSPTAVIEPGDGFAAPSDSYAYIPLYEFDSEMNIEKDWRGAPCVQAWE